MPTIAFRSYVVLLIKHKSLVLSHGGEREGGPMKAFAALLALPLAFAVTAGTPASAESPPAWAYPANPPDFKPSPDDGALRRVPGSTGYADNRFSKNCTPI
jgi:hypothetical protein